MPRKRLGRSDVAFDLGATVSRHGRIAVLALVLLVALATGGAVAEGAIEPSGGGGSGDPGP